VLLKVGERRWQRG